MAKIKNVSGDDRTVPVLGGRLVLAGQVVEVPDELEESFTCQEVNWQSVDKKTKATPAADSDSQEG